MVEDNRRPGAVLADRDGAPVVDVPYCAAPGLVRPVPTGRHAGALLRGGAYRSMSSRISPVSTAASSASPPPAVSRRADELPGSFAAWRMRPRGPDDGCGCRKPRPGTVLSAAAVQYLLGSELLPMGAA